MSQDTITPEKSIIPLGAKGIELKTFDELYRFSQFVVKSGFAPRGIDTPEKAFLALQMGLELGFSPMAALQNTGVINGRPGIYGRATMALIQSQPDFVDMRTEWEGPEDDPTACKVTIERRGKTPSIGRFSMANAKSAGLTDDPGKAGTWGKYKARMMYWRAVHLAEDIYSDVLKGLKSFEAMQDDEGFDSAQPARVVEIKKPEFDKPVSPEKGLEEIRKTKEAVAKAEPPEPKKAVSNIAKTSAIETLSAKLHETGLQQIVVLKVLHANFIGLKAQEIGQLSEKDAEVALENWTALEEQARKMEA